MKRTAGLLLLVSLSASTCLASVVNTTKDLALRCPVALSSVHFSRHKGNFTELSAEYINATQVKVIGFKISVSLMDATGDYESLGTVASAEQLKPGGHSFFGSWDVLTMHGFPGYKILVEKVAFSDGSVWVNDASDKCSYMEDDRMK